MTTRFAWAVLAGMVAIALVGGVLYGVVFQGFFAANLGSATGVMKSPPDLGWVALAHLPFGLLLALVIRWRGRPSAWRGAQAGAILGFLMAAAYDFSQYGTTHLWNLRLTLVDPLLSAVLIAAGGAGAGWVLGRR